MSAMSNLPKEFSARFAFDEMVARKVDPEERCQIIGVIIYADASFRYIIMGARESDPMYALESELIRWSERFEFVEDAGDENLENN